MSANGPEFDPAMQADEPLTPFDVTRSSQRSGLFKLAVGVLVLLALAFLVLKIYQPGVRDRGDPPLITADNTPFKVVPDDPGGLQVPDQDKEVFDMMSGAETGREIVTLPQPEIPVEIPTNSSATDDQAVDPTDPVEVEPLQPTQTQRPDPIVDRPATRPAPQPAPVREAPIAIDYDWVVQVASLRSQAEAERTYEAIQSRHSMLNRYASDIVRVDLAEKGIYYRARVSGFGTKADADDICRRLKAAGQACFVTRR